MSRSQIIILILTMPFWLGTLMVLWVKNPLFILVPVGVITFGLLVLASTLLYAAEIKTRDDWDLLIRSILHRLGFAVQPPKSLHDDSDLHIHHHSKHQHDTEKDGL